MLVLVRLVNGCTPGCILIRFVTSRFARGMSRTCLWSTVAVTSGEVVEMSELPASTVMFSLTLPSSSRAVSECSCATATATFVNVAVLKPCNSMSILYVPTETCGNRNAPVSLETAVWT